MGVLLLVLGVEHFSTKGFGLGPLLEGLAYSGSFLITSMAGPDGGLSFLSLLGG